MYKANCQELVVLSPLICFVLHPHVLPLCDVSNNEVMLCYILRSIHAKIMNYIKIS